VRGPQRSLDIDILTYGDAIIDEPGLQVPHPRIAERAFVLAPLAEIAPGLVIGGETLAVLADRLGLSGVTLDRDQTQRLRNGI
jgi:2-amino-4-hydroxy-6-hydroxymethyldihydropteridine diphosphokinase